jgi:radical SAM protein with 4Fe4S-binding SPASM domain
MEAFTPVNGAQRYLVQRARQHVVPLGVHIDVTYRCDLACVHCYLEDRKRQELSLAEYEGLFDELRELGTLHLLISGGEIFHRPDGLEIIRAARKRRFEVRLITHGGHIDEVLADELAALHIACISMSLYAADPVLHDQITKVPGSWERTTKAARFLAERGVPTNLKCVLMNLNPDVADSMRALARELGVTVEFSVDIKGDNAGSDSLMDLNLDPEQKVGVLGCIYPALINREGLAAFSADEYTCMAGNASCYISPDGTVQPCLDWEEPAGNIRDQKFAELWLTAPVFVQARTIRRNSFSGCVECSNHGHCGLCPARSLRETGSPTGTAPSKCRETISNTIAWMDARSRATLATPKADNPAATSAITSAVAATNTSGA